MSGFDNYVFFSIWLLIPISMLVLGIVSFFLFPKLRAYDEEEVKKAGHLGAFLPGIAINKTVKFILYTLRREYQGIVEPSIVKYFTIARYLMIITFSLVIIFLGHCLLQ